MHRPRPNRLHDELDALLDGRPVELTDELAPLVEAADVLRIELAAYQLDPEVADRHLERVLGAEGGDPGKVVQLPVRQPAGSWDVRRRIVAVALAAALVLAPATIASAAALPGQAMYPFKLAIEQVRIASVQWSPGREAGERTRVADERLEEVQSLFKLEMFAQLPNALLALERAVVAAEAAIDKARQEGELPGKVQAKLIQVRAGGGQVVEEVRMATASGSLKLTGETRQAVVAAVQQSQDVLRPPGNSPPPPTPGGTPPQATAGNPPANTAASESTTGSTSPPNTTSPPQTTQPQPTNPPTTVPPTTVATPPPDPPPTTAATPESPTQEGRVITDVGKAGDQVPAPAEVEEAPPAAGP